MSARFTALLARVTIVVGVNDDVVFDEGAGDLTATLAPGSYYLRGSGGDDLAAELASALTAAGAHNYTATTIYSSAPTAKTCEVTLADLTGTVDLKFAAGGTTFDPALLGFAAANTGAASSHASVLSPSSGWASDQPRHSEEPSPHRDLTVNRTPGGQTHHFLGSDTREDLTLILENISEARTLRRAAAADLGRALQSFWDVHGAGDVIELHGLAIASGFALETATASTLVNTVKMSQSSGERFPQARPDVGQPRYNVTLDWLDSP